MTRGFWLVALACGWWQLAGSLDLAIAHAGSKGRECKPGAAPTSLTIDGNVAQGETVEYRGELYVLTTDRNPRPDHVRLFAASGDGVELAKPPTNVEISAWLARGTGVFALGKARNPSSGQLDVVLLRWGSDTRPRLSALWTGDSIDAPAQAALSGEYLGAAWSAPGADGKPHVFVSAIDLEDIHVAEPLDVGPASTATFLALSAETKGFSVIWQNGETVMHASVDVHGRPKGEPSALGDAKARLLAAVSCGEQSWLVHEGAGKDVVLALADADEKLHDVAHLQAPPAHDRLPMSCLPPGVIVGHRMLTAKPDNVVFWLSAFDPKGNVRERRLRDIRGTGDDLHDIQLGASGDKHQAAWLEGKGPGAKLYFRDFTCD